MAGVGMLALLCVYFFITLGVAVVAFRGVPVRPKPFCRACRFDLSGLIETVACCPECGADLSRRRAVRRPRRKRSSVLVVGALALLASGVAAVVLLGVPFVRPGVATMDSYKPVWLLLAQSEGGAGLHAREELLRRALDPNASDALLGRLAARALEVQGDTKREWTSEWAQMLGRAEERGVLDEMGRRRYRSQAIEIFKVEPWSPTTAGLSTAFRFRIEARVMQRTPLPATALLELVRFRAEIDGQVLADYRPTGLAGAGAHLIVSDLFMVAPGPVGAPPGTRTARVTLLAALGEELTIRERTVVARDKFGRPLDTILAEGSWTASIERTVECPVEVLPEGTPDIELVTGPEVDVAMRAAVRLSSVTAGARDTEDGSTRLISSSLSIEAAPVPAVLRVVYRSGERTWTAAQPVVTQFGAASIGQFDRLRFFPSNAVDVVLVPAEREAMLKPWARRVYGGELVFESVQVKEGTP